MCRTRSIPWMKPPSTASHSSLPWGGSPRRARTLRHPCCLASYNTGCLRMSIIWRERALTRNAMSTFSLGIFVQVKCMHVSIPMILWHVLTISEVRSDVLPPAFLHPYMRSISCPPLSGELTPTKWCLWIPGQGPSYVLYDPTDFGDPNTPSIT